jgi:hypothetical protein
MMMNRRLAESPTIREKRRVLSPPFVILFPAICVYIIKEEDGDDDRIITSPNAVFSVLH